MKNKIVVVSGEHKHEVAVAHGQMVTIWKLGDPKRGWIPSKKHFDAFMKCLQLALEETQKGRDGHIVFHYGVTTEQVKL